MLPPAKTEAKIMIGEEFQARIPSFQGNQNSEKKSNEEPSSELRPSILRMGKEYEYEKYAQVRVGSKFQVAALPMPKPHPRRTAQAGEGKEMPKRDCSPEP